MTAPIQDPTKPARELAVADYVNGVLAGDRAILSRTITLIESSSRAHERQAKEVLDQLMPHSGKSRRVGITGVPGVGKSTFIEALGCYLVEHAHKVAVLTIDPSSTLSGGSILGDKTRMERLSRENNAYIRPSPADGNPGGVARRTRETMLVCEAAGFDILLVESVGVGQAEVTLRSMVDFFLLLLLPGAGDELQGIKKGIMEIADGVLINKCDANRLAAEQSRLEQSVAVHCLQPATAGWKTEVALCSARTGEGIPQVWQRIEQFYTELDAKGVITARRRQQALDWLGDLLHEKVITDFYEDPRVEQELPKVRQAILRGEITAARGASLLISARTGQTKLKSHD
jgi:LAO/AO transport system kinase